MPSSSTLCPYCASGIPAAATVCRHCRRDVEQLVRAREEIAALRRAVAEIEALKRQVAALRPSVAPAPAPESWHPAGLPAALATAGGPSSPAAAAAEGAAPAARGARRPWLLPVLLLAFYAVPLPLFIQGSSRGPQVALGLALLVGGALAYAGWSNVWTLAVYGVAQPFAMYLIAFTFDVLDLEDIIFGWNDLLRTGLVMAAAALAVVVADPRQDVRSALALPLPVRGADWKALLASTDERVKLATGVVAGLLGLAGSVAKLLGAF